MLVKKKKPSDIKDDILPFNINVALASTIQISKQLLSTASPMHTRHRVGQVGGDDVISYPDNKCQGTRLKQSSLECIDRVVTFSNGRSRMELTGPSVHSFGWLVGSTTVQTMKQHTINIIMSTAGHLAAILPIAYLLD